MPSSASKKAKGTVAKAGNSRIEAPPEGEELFKVTMLPPGIGITQYMVQRYEAAYPHIRLRSLKMPGGRNTARLTCRSWVREFICALAAERK